MSSKKIFPNRERTPLCENHPGQPISHFCCIDSCISPLCAKCIKDHNSIHRANNQFPEIETIEDVKLHCGERVRNSIVNFTGEIEKLEKLVSGDFIDENDSGMRKISEMKQMILKMVYEYFQEQEKKYKRMLIVKHNDLTDLHSQIQRLKASVTKMDTFYCDLDSENSILTIKHILTRDFDSELGKTKKDMSLFIDQYNMNKVEVYCDETRVKTIYRELEQMMQVKNTELIGSVLKPAIFSSQQSSSSNPNYIKQSTLRSVLASPMKSAVTTMDSRLSPRTGRQKYANFQIMMHDYFDKRCTRKYLHFFQHKSKSIHILNLERITDHDLKFYKIDMNIDFKIPRWHRSIGTPSGQIYINGGVSCDEQEEKLRKAYWYDYENNTLVPTKDMRHCRSGHGIAYMDHLIYVIGGFTEEEDFSEKCERYNIHTNEWKEICPLNFKSNNPCVCSYRNKYLFKFGGKLDDNVLNKMVEKYHPVYDKWEIIDYKLEDDAKPYSFTILSSAACVQINHNQILVFGGTHEDYSKKSNQSFLFNINDEEFMDEGASTNNLGFGNVQTGNVYSIIGLNVLPLPSAEGFWNSTPIILNRNLFCLQNVGNEKHQNVVYLDRRRILRFNGESWFSYN